jgi:hypothetical protein
MKTTLCISLLLLAVTACGDSDDVGSPAPPVPVPTATTDPPVTPPVTPKRTMGTARAMGTRPENLVLDPTFGSFGTQYSQAVLVQDATAYVETPATSPAGVAQPVIVSSEDGAQPALIFAVQGGTGPLDVRMYISTKDATSPTVSLITPDGTAAFDITPSKEGAQKHGDRTYKMYTAHITDELFGRIYLIVEPNGVPVVVAAPEVTSPAAPATMSLGHAARRVALTPGAAKAARLVTSLPIFHGALPRPKVQR